MHCLPIGTLSGPHHDLNSLSSAIKVDLFLMYAELILPLLCLILSRTACWIVSLWAQLFFC